MIQKILILNLLLSLSVGAAETASLEKVCKTAGGKATTRGCFCWDLGTYVNPWVESCFVTLLDQASLVSKPKMSCCADLRNRAAPRAFSPDVSRKDLCTSPSKYLCDEQINPSVLGSQFAGVEMAEIRQEAENNSAVKQYIKEVSGGKAQHCSELRNPDWNFCHRMVEKIIKEKLYTADRKQKALDLFEKARGSIISFLENQKKYFSLEKEKLETIGKMIAKVRGTKLYFGLDLPGRSTEYNAFQLNEIPDDEKRWYDNLSLLGTKGSSVFLEGVILQIDTNPQAVYMVLLHELGHTFDGVSSEFRKDSNQEGHPFQKEMSCFRDERSVGVKSADWSCLESQAQRVSETDTQKAADLRGIVETLKKNPDMQWVPVAKGLDDHCQMGQLGEAFADWVASEAFVLENKEQLLSVGNVTEPVGFVDLKSRLEQMPTLGAFIADTCLEMNRNKSKTRESNFDSHPIERDRLDAVILAHPLVNRALGCSSASVTGFNFSEMKPMDPNSSNRMYCGRQNLTPQGALK